MFCEISNQEWMASNLGITWTNSSPQLDQWLTERNLILHLMRWISDKHIHYVGNLVNAKWLCIQELPSQSPKDPPWCYCYATRIRLSNSKAESFIFRKLQLTSKPNPTQSMTKKISRISTFGLPTHSHVRWSIEERYYVGRHWLDCIFIWKNNYRGFCINKWPVFCSMLKPIFGSMMWVGLQTTFAYSSISIQTASIWWQWPQIETMRGKTLPLS